MRAAGLVCFFFQAEDGKRDSPTARGVGEVYKRKEKYRIQRGCFFPDHWGLRVSGPYALFSGAVHVSAETAVSLPHHGSKMMGIFICGYIGY